MSAPTTDALVLAAGKGTRMLPLTATQPKPLLPVAGRPMLSHILAALGANGVRRAVVLVGWHGEEVRRYYRDHPEDVPPQLALTFLEQGPTNGTAHAVGRAKGQFKEPFLCVYGDGLVTADALVALRAGKDPEGTAGVVAAQRVPDVRRFGEIVVGSEGRITAVREKEGGPAPRPGLINTGIYWFRPEILDLAAAVEPSARGERELTDALAQLAGKGRLVARTLAAGWTELTFPWDLLGANETLLADLRPRTEGTIEEGVHIRGTLALGTGSVVKSGTYVEGNVTIGRECVIGPNAYLRGPLTIMDRVKIGLACEVKASIVLDGAHIPHMNYVGDSVIGRNCNLGAGTKIANLRLDGQPVVASSQGQRVETGRRKLGTILGDGVKTGINCSLDVGTVIGEDSFIGPGATARGEIRPRSRLF